MSVKTRAKSNPAPNLLAVAAIVVAVGAAHAAPRPASDTAYERATGSVPTSRPAPPQQQQSIYAAPASTSAAYSSNSAISQSLRSAIPNQDKIYQYVTAAVRSDSNTAGVIRDAVGTASEYAETIVHAAIRIRPDEAELITRTALAIAPQEADRVTFAAIAANPRHAAPAVRGALAGAPAMQARITESARLAAAKYRINDPAFEQALAFQQPAPAAPVAADDDALYFGEEAERDDVSNEVGSRTVMSMRPTLMPVMRRASNIPTPAGNAREY